jgi:hypothetical protein
VNVATNLNLLQNVLPHMPYDDLSIVMLLKKELEYKSIYMICYVRFNIVMKALQQFCQSPISAKNFIKPNWKNLTKFANASKNNDFEYKIIENDINEEILTNSKKC